MRSIRPVSLVGLLVFCGGVAWAQPPTSPDTTRTQDGRGGENLQPDDGPSVASQQPPLDAWRYRRHLGEWWYWGPDQQWLYWRAGQWQVYDRENYRPPPEFFRPPGAAPSPGDQPLLPSDSTDAGDPVPSGDPGDPWHLRRRMPLRDAQARRPAWRFPAADGAAYPGTLPPGGSLVPRNMGIRPTGRPFDAEGWYAQRPWPEQRQLRRNIFDEPPLWYDRRNVFERGFFQFNVNPFVPVVPDEGTP